MMIDTNSPADIEFRMTWNSDAATHIDIYTAKQRLSDPVYAVWGQK